MRALDRDLARRYPTARARWPSSFEECLGVASPTQGRHVGRLARARRARAPGRGDQPRSRASSAAQPWWTGAWRRSSGARARRRRTRPRQPMVAAVGVTLSGPAAGRRSSAPSRGHRAAAFEAACGRRRRVRVPGRPRRGWRPHRAPACAPCRARRRGIRPGDRCARPAPRCCNGSSGAGCGRAGRDDSTRRCVAGVGHGRRRSSRSAGEPPRAAPSCDRGPRSTATRRTRSTGRVTSNGRPRASPSDGRRPRGRGSRPGLPRPRRDDTAELHRGLRGRAAAARRPRAAEGAGQAHRVLSPGVSDRDSQGLRRPRRPGGCGDPHDRPSRPRRSGVRRDRREGLLRRQAPLSKLERTRGARSIPGRTRSASSPPSAPRPRARSWRARARRTASR